MAVPLTQIMPPHNTEAEKAVLGSVLLDPKRLGEVAAVVKSESFFEARNAIIFSAFKALSLEGRGIDLITVSDFLDRKQKLETAGGIAYISSLTDTVPTSANASSYAVMVQEDHLRRELLKQADEIKKDVQDKGSTASSILEKAEHSLFALGSGQGTSAIKDMGGVFTDTLRLIDERQKNGGGLTGIPSGFEALDSMTSGFHKGEMTVIGARPSMGKTALALTMMIFMAAKKSIATGFFSLEMPSVQIGQRALSTLSRIHSSRIRSGLLREEDLFKLQNAAPLFASCPLYIDDTPNIRLIDLRNNARRMKEEHKVEIIFIDYMGLITSENTDAPIYEQQSLISKSLKSLARELDIPVVALCQVARSAEGKEPNLAELRGSGSIEQDADTVIFIHGVRNTDSIKHTSDIYEERKLIIAKQRNGPTGEIGLRFFPGYVCFGEE